MEKLTFQKCVGCGFPGLTRMAQVTPWLRVKLSISSQATASK